jgi:hypothetical protein
MVLLLQSSMHIRLVLEGNDAGYKEREYGIAIAEKVIKIGATKV